MFFCVKLSSVIGCGMGVLRIALDGWMDGWMGVLRIAVNLLMLV